MKTRTLLNLLANGFGLTFLGLAFVGCCAALKFTGDFVWPGLAVFIIGVYAVAAHEMIERKEAANALRTDYKDGVERGEPLTQDVKSRTIIVEADFAKTEAWAAGVVTGRFARKRSVGGIVVGSLAMIANAMFTVAAANEAARPTSAHPMGAFVAIVAANLGTAVVVLFIVPRINKRY